MKANDVDFLASLVQHQQNKDKILGLNFESSMTRAVKQQAIRTAVGQIQEVAQEIQVAQDLRDMIKANRARSLELEKLAAKSRSKAKRNAYYKEASELLVQARQALGQIQEIEAAL